MSALFGPVIQQGYVVPDIKEAIRHWVARGIGPFFIEEHIRPKGEFDGKTIQPDLSAAFAYSGEQQIEVIQQHDDDPTIYQDYLEAHPEGGLQHLAVWVDDIADVLADLHARGQGYTVRQRYGDGHAYIDSDDAPGVMMQLMARSDHLVALMEAIRAASIGWDGATAPIRRIDWSTGKPIPEVIEGCARACDPGEVLPKPATPRLADLGHLPRSVLSCAVVGRLTAKGLKRPGIGDCSFS